MEGNEDDKEDGHDSEHKRQIWAQGLLHRTAATGVNLLNNDLSLFQRSIELENELHSKYDSLLLNRNSILMLLVIVVFIMALCLK